MNHIKLHCLGFTSIFILAVVDISAESKAMISYFVPVLAVLPALLAFVVAKYIKFGVYKGYSLWGSSYISMLLGLLGWAYYAFNGKSDPNTSAHMHIVLFPVIHLVFSLCLIVVGYVSEIITKFVLTKKLSRRDKVARLI